MFIRKVNPKNYQNEKQKQNPIKKKYFALLGIALLAVALSIPFKTKAQEEIPIPTLLLPQTKNITSAKPLIAGVSKNKTVIEIYLDYNLVGRAITKDHPSGTGSFSWQPVEPLSLGEHLLNIRAVNTENQNKSYLSETKILNLIPFGGPTLFLPDGLVLTKAFSYVEGVAHSSSSIHIFVDNRHYELIKSLDVHSSGAVGFKYFLKYPLTSGTHTIYLQAEDPSGRNSLPTSSRTVKIVDLPAPTLLTPENNTKTLSQNPVFTGVAFNNSQIEILANSKPIEKFSISNNPQGPVANFVHPLKTKLERSESYIITLRAKDKNGRISQESNQINLTIEQFYIPPTLLKITYRGEQPTIAGVAHNDSIVQIFVDNRLDSTITPTNDSSGTTYFTAQLSQPLSYDKTYKITAKALDQNNKPSQFSNSLIYTLTSPTPPIAKQEPSEPIAQKQEGKKETEIKKEKPLTIKEETKTGEIKVEEKKGEEKGKVKTEDEEKGKITEEEKPAQEELVTKTKTNLPVVLGVLILVGLAIVFITWYLSQKHKLLDDGIEKLFSDEGGYSPDAAKPSDTPDTSDQLSFMDTKETKKEDASSLFKAPDFPDDIPPPPPSI